MYAVRLWSVRRARGLNCVLPRLRSGSAAVSPPVRGDRLRPTRAPGRVRREERQGLAVRLPHVRAVRAELDRHVVPDELPEDLAQRPLRRRARERPLRGQAGDEVRLGGGVPRQPTHRRRRRGDEPRPGRRRPTPARPLVVASGRARKERSRHEVRRRAGARLSAADPAGPYVPRAPGARAARRRVRGHDGARAAGFGGSGGGLQARTGVRRLRRRHQRDRRQRRELPHVEPRGVRAADARRLRAGHADLVPRQESYRDPGRHPRRRRHGRLQHAVPHGRRRAGRGSPAGEAGVRSRRVSLLETARRLRDEHRFQSGRKITLCAARVPRRGREPLGAAARVARAAGREEGGRGRAVHPDAVLLRHSRCCGRSCSKSRTLGLLGKVFILVGVGPLRSAEDGRVDAHERPGHARSRRASIARLAGAGPKRRRGPRRSASSSSRRSARFRGISGVHVMAYRQEESVAEIVDRSGVLRGRGPWHPGRADATTS